MSEYTATQPDQQDYTLTLRQRGPHYSLFTIVPNPVVDLVDGSQARLTEIMLWDAGMSAFTGRHTPAGTRDLSIYRETIDPSSAALAQVVVDLATAAEVDRRFPRDAEGIAQAILDHYRVEAWVFTPGPGTVQISVPLGSVYLCDTEGAHPDPGYSGEWVIGRRYDDGRAEDTLWTGRGTLPDVVAQMIYQVRLVRTPRGMDPDDTRVTIDEARVRAIAARVIVEVLDHVVEGVVPVDVDSFADLHNHIDANALGGVCDDTDPNHQITYLDWVLVQDAVDVWLRGGGIPVHLVGNDVRASHPEMDDQQACALVRASVDPATVDGDDPLSDAYRLVLAARVTVDVDTSPALDQVDQIRTALAAAATASAVRRHGEEDLGPRTRTGHTVAEARQACAEGDGERVGLPALAPKMTDGQITAALRWFSVHAEHDPAVCLVRGLATDICCECEGHAMVSGDDVRDHWFDDAHVIYWTPASRGMSRGFVMVGCEGYHHAALRAALLHQGTC